MWIHENSNWPSFKFDSQKLFNKLALVRYQQGRLIGHMASLGFDLKNEASLITLTDDVVRSSAIEGESLNRKEVRSSIAKRLGIDIAAAVPSSRDIDGVVEMMLDATQQFALPLTKERLFNWHAALFPTGRSGMHKIIVGDWRTNESGPMQVVSGPIGREKIHFEAPSASRLENEMDVFLRWFNSQQDLDPILKAGIAHLWFITIHPFEDGNGRVARAICDMALARADNMPKRFYSLSAQIETDRSQYYIELEQQQRSDTDITQWLSWFLDSLGRAIDDAEKTLGNVLYKFALWRLINQKPVNQRQKNIINRMLENDFVGHMNTSKYAKLAKCSGDTALRDIQDLKARGVFIQNPGGGRSTSYRLAARREL